MRDSRSAKCRETR